MNSKKPKEHTLPRRHTKLASREQTKSRSFAQTRTEYVPAFEFRLFANLERVAVSQAAAVRLGNNWDNESRSQSQVSAGNATPKSGIEITAPQRTFWPQRRNLALNCKQVLFLSALSTKMNTYELAQFSILLKNQNSRKAQASKRDGCILAKCRQDYLTEKATICSAKNFLRRLL